MVLSFLILFLASMLNAATIYVVNGLDESLGWINTQTGQYEAHAVTLGNIPNDVAVTEEKLFVVNTGFNTLQVIDRHSLTTLREIELTGTVNPWAVAVLDHEHVVVTGSVSGTLTIVNFATGVIDTTFATGVGPQSVAVRDQRIFVLNTGVAFPSYGNGYLMIYDPGTFALTDSVSLGVNAQYMEFVGNEVHVACTGNYGDIPGEIDIVDLTNHSNRSSLGCGGTPGAVSVFRNEAFVAAGGWGNEGYVFKYSVETRALINDSDNPIFCGVGASDIQALSDGSFAVSCFSDATVEIRSSSGELLVTYDMSAGPGAICIWWDELDDSPPHLQDVSEFEILRAFPNPFNSTVAFDLKGQIHTSAELRIFDLCGRQVAELPLAVGQNRVFWDAHDGAGQEVAAGAYFVSLKGENERTAKKILYLK